MREADFRRSLRQVVAALDDLNVLLLPRLAIRLQPSAAFKRVVRADPPQYATIFRTGLQERDYNVLLKDFSYLQFYREGSQRNYLGLRYAFYPNPFLFMPFEEFALNLGEDGEAVDVQELYMQFLSEQRPVRTVPVIRFESAPKAHEPLKHPTAHFHLGLSSDGRWPANKILTPLAFALLIVKLYYRSAWEEHAGDNSSNPFEERYNRARAACEVLEEDLFTAEERMQFHFS